jgi:hypothetical protein
LNSTRPRSAALYLSFKFGSNVWAPARVRRRPP